MLRRPAPLDSIVCLALAAVALAILAGCGDSAEATPPAAAKAWAGASSAKSANTTIYSVTVLATLGGSFGSANAINDSGQVVGNSTTSGDRVGHAYLNIGGALRDLASPGSDYGEADAVNEKGQAIGISITGGDPCCLHGFVYREGALQDLGRRAMPHGINNQGQFVGSVEEAGSAKRAFVEVAGSIQILGTLGGSTGSAEAINDKGQIVGGSAVKGDTATHAFLFDGGSMRDLGTLGGNHSYATAVNGQGEAVGYSNLPGDTAQHAFLYRGGRMRDLGSLGGSHSLATAINEQGLVVGFSRLEKENVTHAFVYDGGVMSDLNDLLDSSGAGWALKEARGINKAGRIVGTGTLNGVQKAFMLSPVRSTR